MISGIYKIQSVVNPDRIYIGSASNILTRKNTHYFLMRNNRHHSKKLQRHFNKYGESDLVFSLITECDIDRLIIKEQCYINVFQPYFNCSKFARSRRGVPWSEETRSKLTGIKKPCSEHRRLSMIGNKNALGFKHSEETCNKHRVKASDKTKDKMRKNALNRLPELIERLNRARPLITHKPHTEETKKKLSDIALERHRKNRSYRVI